MKLKVLPPTLRKKHHYLILDIKSEFQFSKEELLQYSWDSCIRYWGENHSSNFDLWVMRHYLVEETIQNNEPVFNYKTVLRCQRSYEDDVRVALSTLTRYNKKRIAINTIGIAGTIKSGISKYIEE